MLIYRGQMSMARERLESALVVLSTEPDVDTVKALLDLAHVQNVTESHDQRAYTAQALELAQSIDVGDVLLSRVFVVQGVAFAISDRAAEAAAALEYAARLAARAGDREGEGRALTNLSDVLAPVDPAAAAEAARAAVERSRQVGARRQLAFSLANLGEALLTVGEWDEAAAVFHDAYERDGLGSDDITHIVFARLVALRGDLDATRQLLDAGLGRFRDSEDPQDLCAVRLIDALQAAAIGDDAGALDHAQAAAGYERDLGVRAESIRWAWPLAARSARNVGDGATEQKLLDGLDQHPLGKLPLVLRAERDLVRARLTAQSDDVEAARLFDQAIEAYRKIPAPFHLAHALLDHAGFLRTNGDRTGAEAAVTEAARIADRLGAKPLARRAEVTRDRSAVS